MQQIKKVISKQLSGIFLDNYSFIIIKGHVFFTNYLNQFPLLNRLFSYNFCDGNRWDMNGCGNGRYMGSCNYSSRSTILVSNRGWLITNCLLIDRSGSNNGLVYYRGSSNNLGSTKKLKNKNYKDNVDIDFSA